MHADSLFEKSPRLKHLPQYLSEFWIAEITKYREQEGQYKQQALKKFEMLKHVTYLLYKAGVPMLAGTDAMNSYCYPGYNLHDEHILHKSCGLPDAEVLKMATLNAGQFLNKADYGELKEGRIALYQILNKTHLRIKVQREILNMCF